MKADKAALVALAERVEALTGPSREVDAEIGPPLGLRVEQEGHPLGLVCYDRNRRAVPLPRFTASLDVAMTLVPEGWDWTAGTEFCEGFPPAYAQVNPKAQPFPVELDISVEAATPALALCAAALRARAEQCA